MMLSFMMTATVAVQQHRSRHRQAGWSNLELEEKAESRFAQARTSRGRVVLQAAAEIVCCQPAQALTPSLLLVAPNGHGAPQGQLCSFNIQK
jgi:hypothetical protein